MKKKIIPLISIILSILLTISCLSLSVSAIELEDTHVSGTLTDLTGTTWFLKLTNSAPEGVGIFDVSGVATDGIHDQEFTTIGIGYAYYDGQYVSTIGYCACVRTASEYYNYPYDNAAGGFTLSFTGGDDAENSELISALQTYGELQEEANPDADFPVLPGSYTFTRGADLIASMSTDWILSLSAVLSHPAITNMDGTIEVSSIQIISGEPASVLFNGIYTNSLNVNSWLNVANDTILCPVLDSVLTINETVYSQALLDFLTLNTDYEEVNMPEDPIEYITLPVGVYIFDPLLQVPSNSGVYSIEFRSDQTTFYGISLSSSVLSYGNSALDAFAPIYDYSDNTWAGTELRFIMLEQEQRVDKRLGDYILAETEYLTLDDYSYFYNQGYDSGYDQGYLEGKNLADSDAFIDGFFGDFFGGVREALDSLVLYESTNTTIPIVVSVWDVISTIVMLFIILFVLKLVAGG